MVLRVIKAEDDHSEVLCQVKSDCSIEESEETCL